MVIFHLFSGHLWWWTKRLDISSKEFDTRRMIMMGRITLQPKVGIIIRIILHRPCQKSYPSFQIGRYLICHIEYQLITLLLYIGRLLAFHVQSTCGNSYYSSLQPYFFYIIDRTVKTSFSFNPQTILFVREGCCSNNNYPK